jgi:hypothetical protein
MMYVWKGHASPALGWRYSRETMQRLDAEGRIWYPDSKDKRPRLIRYLDESAGQPATSVWADVSPVNSQATERLNYDTQKPEALLERSRLAASIFTLQAGLLALGVDPSVELAAKNGAMPRSSPSPTTASRRQRSAGPAAVKESAPDERAVTAGRSS